MLRLLTFLILVLALAPATAQAAGGVQEVIVIGDGRVTGTGIDCPGDCLHARTWTTPTAPTNRLTASPGPGRTVFWEGCMVVEGQPNQCDAPYNDPEFDPAQITASFRDVIPPLITVTSPQPESRWGGPKKPSMTATATATDGGGVASVTFELHGRTVVDTTAPYSAVFDVSTMPSGLATLRVRAVDTTGNAAAEARLLVIDNEAPPLTPDGGVAEGALVGPVPTTLVFKTQLVDGESVACRAHPDLGGQPVPAFGPCTTGSSHTVTPNRDGTWYIQVRTLDEMGNARYYTRWFRADVTAPTLTVGSSIPDSGWVRQGVASTMSASASDANGVTVECRPAGDEFRQCSQTSHPNTIEGEHNWDWRAYDSAGNMTTVRRTWRVDGTAPAVTIVSGPADGATVPPGEVAFAVRHHDAGSGVTGVTCSWDDGPFEACAPRTLSAGDHRFRVRVEDRVGLATVITRSFKVVQPGDDPGTADPGSGSDGPGTPPGTGDPGPGAGPSGDGPTGPSGGPAAKVRLAIQGTRRLRIALRSGLKVAVSGAAPGKRIALTARRGARVMASGRARVAADGTATVVVRFTKAARRSLSRARKVQLTVTAAGATAAVTLRA